MTQKRKLQETLNGEGKVYNNEEFIADVSYRIEIAQDYILVDNKEIPARKHISGLLTFLAGDFVRLANWNKGSLTLRLADGRSWEFNTSNMNPRTKTFTLMNVKGIE